MATIYFTNTANNGTGSLRTAVSNAQDGDTIMPDPSVFAAGSTVHIPLASYITISKSLTLSGGSCRVKLTTSNTTATSVIVLSNNVANFSLTDYDLVGRLTLSGCESSVITRCRVYGTAIKTGGVYAQTGKTIVLNDCLITGWKGHGFHNGANGTTTINRSTIAGNVQPIFNGSGTTVEINDSIVDPVCSQVGFIAPPPDDLEEPEEDVAIDWSDWDLHLLPTSPYATGATSGSGEKDVEGTNRGVLDSGATRYAKGAYELAGTGFKIVTSTADSGNGTLRAAITAASSGDAILFAQDVFPVGQTTPIYLSSYLSVSKSVGIYGGTSLDEDGNYTSGATLTRYVKRVVNDVETEVVVTDQNPAQDGETVLFHVTNRVALDGQNTTGLVYTNVESTINYIGVAFINGNRTDGGGIRTNARVTATFAECAFDSCAGTNGGALRSENYSNLTITDCSFKSCSGSNGAAFNSVNTSQNAFNRCCFDSCVAVNYGGALYFYGNSVNAATNCVFYNNSTTTHAGGAIYASSLSQNTISACLFDGCSATTSGGGVSTASNSRNTISNCEFKNGAAVNGGAIYAASTTTHTLTSCSFESCSATNSGGALYSDSSSQNVLTDCDFTSCAAKTGGALYSTSASQNSFSECSFQSNNATNGGGAVYAYSLSENTFSECSFENNTATSSGGAIIATTLAQNKLTDCDFKNNSAQHGGAAITYAATQNVFTRCSFQTNTATNGGGVIAMNGASQNAFDSCSFNGNTAASIGGAMRVLNASQVVFLGTNTFSDCEAPSGSGIYCASMRPIVGTPTFSNCDVEYEVNPATGQTRYFTTTADSGTGSLRSVLAACNNNDTIEPDPQTFAHGSTITIRLSSVLNATKRVHLRGSGRRIVLDGQDACPCVSCSDAAAWDMFDVTITGGYNSSNSGAAMILSGNSGAILTRCVVAGSKSYRPIYTTSAGSILAVSSIITGNYATNAWPGCSIKSFGSTIEGNYVNGTATNATTVEAVNGIAEVLPSTVGFKVAPPDTVAAEDWNKDLWREWNLALTSESSYATGFDSEEFDTRWEVEDGSLMRDYNGYARSENGERGAFATSDVDLYWTGYDSNGDPVSEPSFESADGWATNPAERNASDRTPQSGDAVLIRGAATFDGVVEAQTVYLSGDENITLTSSDQSGINVARFQYSGTLTVAGTALFTGATDDLTLVVEGTLIVADDTTIKNLTLDDGATVSFSDAEITLTVSDDANVGEATLTCETPNARFTVPAGTDLSAATFHNVGAASDGSRVESVSGTKIGKNYAIFINTFGNNPLVSVEYKATDSSVWTVAAPAFSGTTFTIKLDGDYEFRVYDGESFHNATIKVFGLYHEMCAKVQIGYLI